MTAQSTQADLVHASHVRLAYRAMLGREPSPAEIRVQLAGLRTTGELLQILTDSAEFTGSAQVLLDAPKADHIDRVNIWHEDVAGWHMPAGTVSGDAGAVVGSEGWLFEHGGPEGDVDHLLGTPATAPGWTDAWSALLRTRGDEAARRGLTTASLIVPDKLVVESEHAPAPHATDDRRPAQRLADELGAGIVYPVEALRAARADGPVSLRTDAKFSLLGNFVLHEALSAALGIEPLPRSVVDDATEYLSAGDLGRRFDPAIVEVMRSSSAKGTAEIVEDNRDAIAAKGGQIGSRRVYRNAAASDSRTAVIYGDGYGFAGPGYEGVSWFLAEQFREVHFVWAPFGWDAGYAAGVGAEVVVSQTAERFVRRVPVLRLDVATLVQRAETRPGAIAHDAVFEPQS